MSHEDDLKDFEEQLRLQSSTNVVEDKKTRVDPDGVVMEWDKKRKAWFPKIDDDFIANYQMNYGVNQPAVASNDSTSNVNWGEFETKLAQLRQEKGENSEEVKQLTKDANEALYSYYNSPAYREWYEKYSKYQEEMKQSLSKTNSSSVKKNKKSDIEKPKLKKGLTIFHTNNDDTDLALAKAEAELQSGEILQPAINNDTDILNQENREVVENNECNVDLSAPLKKRKQTAPLPAWYDVDESKNTHVYVSGLPPTITDEEFIQLMSKCGIIMNEPFTDKLRAKLYRDEEGKPKGDGRCCYIKVESVDLALNILDGMLYEPGFELHVERAKFQPKGEFDPKKRRRLTVKEKKKLKIQQENLFRWRIDTSKYVRGKKERVIIVKNAFIESDFKNDVTLIALVKERLRAHCIKCGAIKKIVVHDANPDGVVSVTFCTPEEADMGLNFLDKALFDYPGTGGNRQLTAERWDGKTNYNVKESVEDENERLQNWESYIAGKTADDSSDSSDADEKDVDTEEFQEYDDDVFAKEETDIPHSYGDDDDDNDDNDVNNGNNTDEEIGSEADTP